MLISPQPLVTVVGSLILIDATGSLLMTRPTNDNNLGRSYELAAPLPR